MKSGPLPGPLPAGEGKTGPHGGTLVARAEPLGASLRLPRRRSGLKTGIEFSAIKNSGRRMARGSLIANWTPSPAGQSSKLGVITSKRIGPAVVRSRARRLLREAFRLHQHELAKPIQLVLIARNSIVGKACADVEKDLISVLRDSRLLTESV